MAIIIVVIGRSYPNRTGTSCQMHSAIIEDELETYIDLF